LFDFGPILWANQGWTLTSVFERLLQSLNLFITLICLEQTGVFLVWNWIAFVFACWCILSMFLFIFELCFWYCLEKENQLFKLGTYHPFKLWLITPVKSSCKQTGFGILDIEIMSCAVVFAISSIEHYPDTVVLSPTLNRVGAIII